MLFFDKSAMCLYNKNHLSVCVVMSGTENLGHDRETSEVVDAQNDVIDNTNDALNDLASDIISSQPESSEIQREAMAEQFYQLGKTEVQSGNLDDVKNAIDAHDTMTHTKITILGGADQIFMSEEKGQKILDDEIAKLEALKSGFSGSNVSMIDALIAELTDGSKHQNLASQYPRADGRSNLGNARLVAARIASGYTEVLTTIQNKIASTGTEVSVSYDIPWESCIIGNTGNQLSDRKIHVDIVLDTKDIVDVDNNDQDNNNQDNNNQDNNDQDNNNQDNNDQDNNNQDNNNQDNSPELPIDIDKLKANLITDYNAIKLGSSLWTYESGQKPYTFSNRFNETKYPDKHVLEISQNGVVVMEIGIYVSGPKKGIKVIGLGNDVYGEGKDLNIDTLRNKEVIDHIVATLNPVKQQDVIPSISEVPPTSMEISKQGQEVVLNFPDGHGDVVTAAGHPDLYTHENGYRFPNVDKIRSYYETQGLQVDLIVPSQTYEKDTELTDFFLDNGKFGGQYKDLEKLKKEQKGLLIKHADGTLEFTHTDDIQDRKKIPKDVDILMLGSVKRPGKNLNEKLIGTAVPNRYLVKKTDGSTQLLVLYGTKEEQKKILDDSQYERALYLDVNNGGNYQIDGYWSNYKGKLTYGHYDQGDVLRDGSVPTEVKKGNMPAILVMTSPLPKEENTAPAQNNTVTEVENVPGKEADKLATKDDNADPITKVPDQNIPVDKKSPDVLNSIPLYLDLDTLPSSYVDKLKDNVVGISTKDLAIGVNAIRDKGLRMKIIDELLFSTSHGGYNVMRILGMSDDALVKTGQFGNQIPKHEKIDKFVLEKMKQQNRVYRNYENVLSNKDLLFDEFGHNAPLPQDVRDSYIQFAYKNLAAKYKEAFTSRVVKPSKTIDYNNKPYAIVSKSDGHVYLFDSYHSLVSRKAALLGTDKSNAFYDVKDYSSSGQIPKRTSQGLYKVNSKQYKGSDIGYYMPLIPQDGQMRYRKYSDGPNKGSWVWTIGFHKIYEPLKTPRNEALKGDNINSKFMTDGCINIDTDSYSEIWDHLQDESLVYVTK